MSAANPFFVALLLVGITLAIALALGVVLRKRSSVTREYVLVLTSLLFYTLPYAAELASVSLAHKLFFHRVVWIGVAACPSATALLALAYARRKVPRWVLAFFAVLTMTFVVLEWTNDLHHWLEGPPSLVSYGAFSMRKQSGEWAYWMVFVPYAYLCMFGSLAIYCASWLSGPPIQRRQARALFVALLLPLCCNIVYNVGGSPIHEVDLTPLSMGAAAFGFAWAIFREGFLDLVPVAHDVVVERIDDPIFVIDAQRRLVDANPAARALVDRPFVAGIAAKAYLDVFDDWSPATRDVRIAGRAFELRSTNLDDNGHVIIFRDVTERAEAARATQRALLARAEFIARMSHELRTPLQGIMGSIELLRRTSLDVAQVRFADDASLSSRVLLGLVDEVLDFERVDDGIVLDARDVDAQALVIDVLAVLRDSAALKGLALEADTSGVHGVLLRGDPRRIRQIVLNLAANAVKFTDHGSVRIVTSVSDTGLLRVRIDDSGPGVPEAHIASLGAPFFQLDGSRTRSAGGVGLGLAICRRLATAMKGEVVLENRAQGGLAATFTVTLPLAQTMEPSAAEPAEARRPHALRVLLVEDHPVSRAVVQQMLEALGVEVTTAESATQGIVAATRTRSSIALVDLHLPGTDGLAVTRALRALEHAPQVILFTADARAAVRDEALAAGAAEVLLKPASIDALDGVLRRHGASSSSVAARPSLDRAELHAAFESSYPRELAEMRRALEAGELARCVHLVHSLLGASALLGLEDVAARCRTAIATPTHAALEAIEHACAARPQR